MRVVAYRLQSALVALAMTFYLFAAFMVILVVLALVMLGF